jgi:prevent-host-death family protein
MYDKPKKPGDPWVMREAAAAYLPGGPEREVVSAADFKTHCLRLIDQVRQGRTEVVVTRYGKPVAKLVPYDEERMSIFGHLAGSVASYGDLVSPIDEAWDADA